jgi:hypothetical protein
MNHWYSKADEVIVVPANEWTKAHLIKRHDAIDNPYYKLEIHISGHLWKERNPNPATGNIWVRCGEMYREHNGDGSWWWWIVLNKEITNE